MTVSARKAGSQENPAAKRIFTTRIMQASRKHRLNPLGSVKAGPQALWQRMATEHQRAWSRSDADGAYRMLCWPSQSRLAAQLNVSVNTIRRWTRALQAAGLIEVEIVAKPGEASCLKRCSYALVAPMRVGSMPPPRARTASQSPRGIARHDYVRKPKPATTTTKAEVIARRNAEQDQYVQRIAAHDPAQAAALARMIELQRKREGEAETSPTLASLLDPNDHVQLAAEVARIVPGITLSKASHMARTNPHALVQALDAWRDHDVDDMSNPAGYLVGIFSNIAKRERIGSLSHAA